MKLTEHFTLEELTITTTGLKNIPEGEILDNLLYTAEQMEKVREILGTPIIVNSGYRSNAVNKAVGGVNTSAHSFGFAVDFISPEFGSPYDICKKLKESGMEFDQLIHEKRRWVHIGFGLKDGVSHRNQVLTLLPNEKSYRSGLFK